MDLVKLQLVDPVRVFIKDEPHKISKAQQGRFRLISSVSLVDQIIERLCFAEQNFLEVLQHEHIPSKPGMGLHDDGLQAIYNTVSTFDRPVEADVSAWDWSVQEWQLQMDVDFRIWAYGLQNDDIRANLMRNRVTCLSRTVYCTSDGNLYSQLAPGIQLSGSYNTSSTNSRIRVLTAYGLGVPKIIAMGDDSIEEFSEGVFDGYIKCGHDMKMYTEVGKESFEFCSTRFDGSWKGYPANADKMFYKLLSHSSGLSAIERHLLYQQWYYEMRHHPDREYYVNLVVHGTTFLAWE
jgi:hypothetical protein